LSSNTNDHVDSLLVKLM